MATQAPPLTAPAPPPAPGSARTRALVLLVVVAAVVGLVAAGRAWGRADQLGVTHSQHVEEVADSLLRWEQAYLGADAPGRTTLDQLMPGSPSSRQPEGYAFQPSYVAPADGRVVVVGQVVTGDRVSWLRVQADVDGRSAWCTTGPPTGDPDKDRCEGVAP